MYVFYHLGVSTLLLGFLTASSDATCNVTLHATTTPQNFTSPNYPHPYNNNDYCFWDVVPSTTGYNIVLDMVYSNIEKSLQGCYYDNLTIYNITSQRIIRTICGSNRWTMNIGGSSPVRVIFTTDYLTTLSGFLIRYYETPEESVCGGTLTATSTEQFFNSPGFPNTYYLGQSCTWIITSQTHNEVVLLQTVRSDIEAISSGQCGGDTVAVYNGVHSYPEPDGSLGTFCGTERPVFISGGDTLKVLFISDQYTNKMGFQMKYRSVPASGYSVTIPASIHPLAIVSPGYPEGYLNSVNCSWTIVPSHLYPHLQLSVHVFDVLGGPSDCSQERLTFNSVYKNGTRVIDTVCNNRSSHLPHQTDGNMTVTFTADGTGHVGRGVRLIYQMTVIPSGCGDSALTARPHIQFLASPNFPYPYNSNGHCIWTIEAYSMFTRVRIVTNTSDLGTNFMGRCHDYVSAYDGRSSYSPQLGRWCGWTQPSYVSSGRYMTIEFKSDSSLNYKGFKIGYTTVDDPAPSCGMSSITASTDPQYLASPGYPYNYKNNMACTWTILAPSGHVRVDVLSVNMETSSTCSYDYLQFYDGNTEYHRHLGKLCGSQIGTYYSTGSYMTIKFVSDNSDVFKGFRLKYEVTAQAPTSHECGITQLTASSSVHGYIHSPGYPSSYGNNVDCRWTITASEAEVVKVEILMLTLQYSTSCVSDYLLISDGHVSTSSQLAKLCGSRAYGSYTSGGNSMVITFHTDSTTTSVGFRLQYIALESPTFQRTLEISHISTTYISSPNYPSYYGSNENRKWLIHASSPYVVSMSVISSNLEDSTSCVNDYVEVFDGQNEFASSLGRWCGSETPDKHSSGQYMYVKFHSDASISGPGFQLGFTAEMASEFSEDSHVNVGGVIGGIAGAVVLLTLVACCVSANRKQSNSNSNNTRNTGRQISCRRHLTSRNISDVYSITSGHHPMSVRPQPATFMPPPAYSEVVKDDPPPYSEALSFADQRHKNNQGATPTVSGCAGVSSGAVVLQGVDNPAGPQLDET